MGGKDQVGSGLMREGDGVCYHGFQPMVAVGEPFELAAERGLVVEGA